MYRSSLCVRNAEAFNEDETADDATARPRASGLSAYRDWLSPAESVVWPKSR
jgi:hypothetical protein